MGRPSVSLWPIAAQNDGWWRVSVASAATMTGTIKSIDVTAETVTLDNGKTFTLGSQVDASALKPGEKVKIIYSGSGSSMKVTAISAASS